MGRSFPTRKECEAHRANPWERCVASDDPSLKGKIAMTEPRAVVSQVATSDLESTLVIRLTRASV